MGRIISNIVCIISYHTLYYYLLHSTIHNNNIIDACYDVGWPDRIGYFLYNGIIDG